MAHLLGSVATELLCLLLAVFLVRLVTPGFAALARHTTAATVASRAHAHVEVDLARVPVGVADR